MIKDTYGMSAEEVRDYDRRAIVFDDLSAFGRAVRNEVRGNSKLQTEEQKRAVVNLVMGSISSEMNDASVMTRRHIRQARSDLGGFMHADKSDLGSVAAQAYSTLSKVYTRKTDDMDVNVFSPDPKPIDVPALIAKGQNL